MFATRVHVVLFVCVACALVGACSGGGGVAFTFVVNGTAPADGAVDAATTGAIAITFNVPADLATVSAAALRLERFDGSPVGTRLIIQASNTTTVRIEPLIPLSINTRYRLIVGGSIRSADGTVLGTDAVSCFITGSGGPTVRPDQIVDLGDRLNVARYLARFVRAANGRLLVFGGFVDDTAATDTIEEWIPATRSFQLLATRMRTPRAEFSATLLAGGRILIAGGVPAPGGAPLATTEFFDPNMGGIADGPSMVVGRRWHGASPFRGDSVMVSGGFGAGGVALDSAEFLDGNSWTAIGLLPEPTAQHVQALFEFDQVYVGSSNFRGIGALFNGAQFVARQEPDIRFRATVQRLSSTRLLIVGGDTRSGAVYNFATDNALLARDLMAERRGAHTLTPRDGAGRLFLIAGGFNIARGGDPPLDSLEIAEFLEGSDDIAFHTVTNVLLPVPFAGHVGFTQPDGATVLAGGWGGAIGAHSRRVVMVLDAGSTPPLACR